MTTFASPLSQITGARLDVLVANQVREGRQLEYKEQLPGGSDDSRREFLADVSSFANTAGGDIIYGVSEKRDAQKKPTGEPERIVGLSAFNFDSERQRLENLLRDCIAPRLGPIGFHEVRRDQGPPCFLVRVPRSWQGLHMVTFKNSSRFFGRNSSGKYQLDVAEIRGGMLATETWRERVRHFREQRLSRVINGETPIPLGNQEKVILHALPLGDTEAWTRFQARHDSDVALVLRPIGRSPNSWHYNLDGFLVRTNGRNPARDCYVQLFRDGGIEAVSVDCLDLRNSHKGLVFSASALEAGIIEAVGSFRRAWEMLEIGGPLVLGLALSGVEGAGVVRDADISDLPLTRLERDSIVLPDILIDDVAVDPPDIMLKPLFDLLWNAGGLKESPNYQQGRWVRG